jgi:hypothetical protein
MVWCTISFILPGQSVTGNFYMQVLQSLHDAVQRKRCYKCSDFCTMITLRATHCLLCSNSSLKGIFLSSPNHHTLWISLRVTFGCSLLWKWTSRGHVSQPWRTSNQMWLKQVCVCTRVLLWRWLGRHCHMSYHYIAIPPFQEYRLIIIFNFLNYINECSGQYSLVQEIWILSPL